MAVVERGLEPLDRADVDDRAAAPRSVIAAAASRVIAITPPTLTRSISAAASRSIAVERHDGLDPRVVDDDVQPAERGDGAVADRRGVALDVADRDHRAVAELGGERLGSVAGASSRARRTDAPASCRRRAIPPPMLPLAPVTIATRPVRSSRLRTGGRSVTARIIAWRHRREAARRRD